MTDDETIESEPAGIEAASGAAQMAAESEPAEIETVSEAVSETAPTAKADKPTKAEKLEAKAARLREAEAARAAAAREVVPGGQSKPGLTITLAIVSVVLLVLLGISLGYGLNQRSKVEAANQLAATRASATRAATVIATDFGSYDYTTLTADLARTESKLTPSLAKSFSQVSASLQATIVADHGKNVATVQGVAISSVHGSTALALVFLDQTVTSSASKTARIDRNRVEMTLVRQKNGSWLASKIGVI
jgi:hypothetical protein